MLRCLRLPQREKVSADAGQTRPLLDRREAEDYGRTPGVAESLFRYLTLADGLALSAHRAVVSMTAMVDDEATNKRANLAARIPAPTRVSVGRCGKFLALPGVTGPTLERVLVTHREHRGSERCLKWKYGTVITRVAVDELPEFGGLTASGDVVVKEVPLPLRRVLACRFGARSRFARDMTIATRLAGCGVRTPSVIAHSLRPRGNAEYQVTAFLPGRTLRQALWLGDDVIVDATERTALLRACGAWVGTLHEAGIWQRDMKPENFIVESTERAFEPWLLDITGLRFFTGRLDVERCTRNLAQLLDLPAHLDAVAPASFLQGYLGTATRDRDRDRWESRIRQALEGRRQRREKRNGFRYVDDEHFGTLDRPGHRIQ